MPIEATAIRRAAFLWISITIPAGFFLKYYSGPGHMWCNNYGAAVLYEIFWCLVIFFFIPRKKKVLSIAAGVFIATCILEFLQLWHPPFLELVRSNTVGVWLIGNGFDRFDFPHYAIGSGLGYLIMKRMCNVRRVTQAENKKT